MSIKFVRVTIFFILSIICLYLIFDQIIMPFYTRHGQEISVPDLTNLFYEDARDKMSKLGLEIIEESKKFDRSNIYPIGVIMSQNPKPGSKVKTGRRIYVIVSKGEPIIEMPDLLKRSERNAIFTLQNKGLELGQVSYDFSEYYPAGQVSYQSIMPGREIKPATIVDLKISLGNYPDKFVVPDVVNRNIQDAKKIIKQAGLTLGAISFEIRDDLLPATVITQSLEAGFEVMQGDTVNLLVSKLPPKTMDEIQ